MQSDGFNSALSPVVYGDIALSINTHYITSVLSLFLFWGVGGVGVYVKSYCQVIYKLLY